MSNAWILAACALSAATGVHAEVAATRGMVITPLGALLDVLGHGMSPEQAIGSPAHGGFDAIVGVHEFGAEYLQQLRELGQPVREDDARRGYWIGIGVDSGALHLRGGELREMHMGGGAVGY